jgi:endoglucanase
VVRSPDQTLDPRLARGVTMTAQLDRPDDTSWVDLQRDDVFREIRRAGFTAVRIAVDFTTAQRQGDDPAGAFHPRWLARIERIARNADRAGLVTILTARAPADLSDVASQARLLADWRTLAQHLRGARDTVLFELLDHPDDTLADEEWSALAERLRMAIRESNPNRPLLVGPAHRYDPAHLGLLRLSPDPRVIYVFSYTAHAPGPWSGTPEDVRRIEADLDAVARWARERNSPIYCASFGAAEHEDPQSHVRWATSVARALEARGIGWNYFDFGGNAGVFDSTWRIWRQPLVGALLND